MRAFPFATVLATITAIVASFSWALVDKPAGGVELGSLRCEYIKDPLGIDVSAPRLSWILESTRRGVKQKAYQILVAGSRDSLVSDRPDRWDSGKVESNESSQIIYAGKPLLSSEQVFWKVRVWDESDLPSPWAEIAQWTMGNLSEQDWQPARWISASGAEAFTHAPLIGFHAAETRQEDDTKWVQVDLGRSYALNQIELIPMVHGGVDGFGFPLRFKAEACDDSGFGNAKLIEDHTGANFPNPAARPVVLAGKEVSGRYVRVTATRLWKRDWAYCYSLRQLRVISGGHDVALGQPVTAKDSVEQFGWGAAALTDGAGSGGGAPDRQYTSMLLRREFSTQQAVKRAIVHVSGLGQYELFINGKKVGDQLLAPGWTEYRKTVLFDTFDVTSQITSGANAVGLILGNGMYNITASSDRYVKFTNTFGPLKAIAQLRLVYDDGTSEVIATDSQWQVRAGPITYSNIFGGEDYDARLEPAGWDRAGFHATDWEPALETTGPGGRLRGQSCAAPPITAHDVLKPISSNPLSTAVTVYDLGQNASLMPRLMTSGPAGSFVRIIPSELLKPDGSVDRASCTQDRGGPSWWQYTLAGKGSESWFPKFFYHGCRYFQVERFPAAPGGALPEVNSIEGVAVHSSSEPIGSFECSNTLFNRIHSLVRWAQRSNMMSLMTDCPHRERLGWLEQTHLNGPSLRYEFDMSRLFSKLTNDMADSQLDNGFVPNISPEYFIASTRKLSDGFRNSPEWGSACVMVPWQQYQFTGDIELLRRHYEGMKRYVAYLGTTANENIVSIGLGDWYDIGPKPPWTAQLTPVPLTATAFYYYDTWVLGQTAKLLGLPAEAQQYGENAREIASAFNRKFFNPQTHQYATGSQTANSIALVMDLVNPHDRAAVLDAVVADVRKRGNSLTAGDVGYRYLLRALAEGGRSDVVFDMNNQSDRPGYGMQLKKGATSLTEKWDASVGTFGSQNHFMLGQIIEWFYHDLAGIQSDPDGPGFSKIIIRPGIVGDITWVNSSYVSTHGKIICNWATAQGELTLNCTIPAGTSATVYIPTRDASTVTEQNSPANKSPAVRFLRQEDSAAIFAIGSGSYSFRTPLRR